MPIAERTRGRVAVRMRLVGRARRLQELAAHRAAARRSAALHPRRRPLPHVHGDIHQGTPKLVYPGREPGWDPCRQIKLHMFLCVLQVMNTAYNMYNLMITTN